MKKLRKRVNYTINKAGNTKKAAKTPLYSSKTNDNTHKGRIKVYKEETTIPKQRIAKLKQLEKTKINQSLGSKAKNPGDRKHTVVAFNLL